MKYEKIMVAISTNKDNTINDVGVVKNVSKEEYSKLLEEKDINDSKLGKIIYDIKTQLDELAKEINSLKDEIKLLKGED